MLSLLENPSLGDVPGPESMDGNNVRGYSGGIDLLTSGEDFGSSRGSISSLLNSTPGAEEASFFDDSVGSYLQDGAAQSHSAAASVDSAPSVENLNLPQLRGLNGRANAEIRMDLAGYGNPRGLNGRASNGESATAKVGKKRSRASRRAPTTVLTTDTSNFRAMVQEFTGIPAGPFPGSLPFSGHGFDFLGARGLAAGSNFLLARPFPQQMVGPSGLPPKFHPRGPPPPCDLLVQSLLRHQQQQQQQQQSLRDSISFPAGNFGNNMKAPPAGASLLEELGLSSPAAGHGAPYREANLKSHLFRDLLSADKRPAQWSNNITCYNKAGGESGERTKAMCGLNSDLQTDNHAGMADREQVDSWISSADQTLDKL